MDCTVFGGTSGNAVKVQVYIAIINLYDGCHNQWQTEIEPFHL
jgi:hypothetical protein